MFNCLCVNDNGLLSPGCAMVPTLPGNSRLMGQTEGQ